MLWIDQNKLTPVSRVAVAEGVFASTPIATPAGWVAARDLTPGDGILTFDAGCRPVRHLHRQRMDRQTPQSRWPVLIPAGTFGRHDALCLPPEQTLLIESDLAEEIYGEAFVTLPALALPGWRGCTRIAPPDEDIVLITLDSAQLVYAAPDLLLGCAGAPTLGGLLGVDTASVVPLGPAAARHLIACMIAEEAGAGLHRAAAG